MQNVEEQKIKLEQKKNRLIAEETRLRLKERKMRTKNLIEMGGLVTKAGLDHLPTNTLYGALLSITTSLETNQVIKNEWAKIGKAALDQEQINKHVVILKFDQEANNDIRKVLRNYSLRWNKFRLEWYGEVADLNSLKKDLGTIKYNIETI